MNKFGSPAVVIDNGSGICKAGISGYNTPFCDFPSIVGRLITEAMFAIDSTNPYIGE